MWWADMALDMALHISFHNGSGSSSISIVHTMCPWFGSVPFSWRVSPMFTGSLRRFAFANAAQKQLIGFAVFADDSDVDHSTLDSSQSASPMVKDRQKGSSFVVDREDGMVQGSKDEEGPTLRIGRTSWQAGFQADHRFPPHVPCGSRGAVGSCFAAMVFASPRWWPMSRYGHAASTRFASVLEAARPLEMICANDW